MYCSCKNYWAIMYIPEAGGSTSESLRKFKTIFKGVTFRKLLIFKKIHTWLSVAWMYFWSRYHTGLRYRPLKIVMIFSIFLIVTGWGFNLTFLNCPQNTPFWSPVQNCYTDQKVYLLHFKVCRFSFPSVTRSKVNRVYSYFCQTL